MKDVKELIDHGSEDVIRWTTKKILFLASKRKVMRWPCDIGLLMIVVFTCYWMVANVANQDICYIELSLWKNEAGDY